MVELSLQTRRAALAFMLLVLNASEASADPTGGAAPASNLLGYVIDETSGRAVANAEVNVVGLDIGVLSNAAGHFILRDLPSGTQALQVTHIGYADRSIEVYLQDGQSHEVTVLMGLEPIELEGLSVSVVPRRLFNDMNGLSMRIEQNRGQFVLRDEIEVRGGNVATLLQGKRSVRIKTSGSAFSGMFAVLRSAKRMQATGIGQYQIVDCYPAVFVNGRRWSKRAESGDEPFDLTELLASELEALEVYAGAASVPGEFGGGDASCGAIVVWTRRGGLRLPGRGRY